MREQTDPTLSRVAITSTTEETYSRLNAGDNVSVTATFDESVIVDDESGTTTLTIAVGSDNRTATYVSGSTNTIDNDSLVFQYTIQPGDNDTDGISIGANPISSYEYVGQLCPQTGVCDPGYWELGGIISKSQAPGVCSVTPGQCIGYIQYPTASFDYANLLSDITPGCYSMSCSDSWPIYLRSTALNSSIITDASGNYATITHGSVADNPSYKVDNTGPTLVDNVTITSSTSNTVVTNPSIDGVCELGDCYLYVTATFNENVTVTGTPRLEITIGQSGNFVNRPADYDPTTGINSTNRSYSGNKQLVFKYAMQNADQVYTDDDGVSIGDDALSLNSGTIKDLAGNDATTITHSLVGANNLFQMK
jgi:hypothetical protein